MEFARLIGSVQSLSSVIDFVNGSGLADALAAFADVHLEAAKLAISRAHVGRDKRAEVWSAINHLQAAHIAQRRVWRKKGWPRLSFGEVSLRSHYGACNDAYVSCLTAICYVFVGEPDSAAACLEKAKEAFEASVAPTDGPIPIGFGGAGLVFMLIYALRDGPTVVHRMLSEGPDAKSRYPHISVEEMDRFCNSVQEILRRQSER